MGLRALFSRLFSRSSRLEAEAPRQATVPPDNAGARTSESERVRSSISASGAALEAPSNHGSDAEAIRQKRQEFERMHGDWTSD